MDTRIPTAILRLIRDDRDRRLRSLSEKDSDAADAQWDFFDAPFINELCLMLLVALRHQVERELVALVARAENHPSVIEEAEYSRLIQCWRDRLRRRNGWSKLETVLDLEELDEWASSMETLRLLANSYKHSPWSSPDTDLVEHLQGILKERPPKLSEIRHFAPIAESQVLVEALGASLDLSEGADYCEIAETLLARAAQFLAEVEARAGLSRVKRKPVSMHPDDSAQ